MTYNPVSGAAIQYSNDKGKNASDYWLKFYIANTTTPLSMATDSTGGTLLAKCKLNDEGYPISNENDNDTIFIPHMNQAYRWVTYRTEAEADANDTASAQVNIPAVNSLVGTATPIVEYIDSVEDLSGLEGTVDDQQISLKGWHPDSDVGGGTLYWDAAALKSTHNGGTIFSPTVPWTTTTADYLNAVGETDPSGTGCWVRANIGVILAAYFGAVGDGVVDDTVAVQSGINAVAGSGVWFDGGGVTCKLFSQITVVSDTHMRGITLDFDDSITDDFHLFVGDVSTDIPVTYNGVNIIFDSVTVTPSNEVTYPVRLRGLLSCHFNNFNIVNRTDSFGAGVEPTYLILDGAVDCSFTDCDIKPNAGYNGGGAPKSRVFNLLQQFNLAFTASAANGLSVTSTSFYNCYLHLAWYIGTILGDNVRFNDCIFEAAVEGVTLTNTGSIISFNDCYWEAIAFFKVYAQGVDTTSQATCVAVRGGKVQMNDDNGSIANHAFLKLEQAFGAELTGIKFQGRAQTRLVEVIAGGNAKIEALVLMDANYDILQRETSASVLNGATVATTLGSNDITITDIGHDKVIGDSVSLTNAAIEPFNGFNLNSPDLTVTGVPDVDHYTLAYYTSATATGTGTTTADTGWYNGNCLTQMDDQLSTDFLNSGTHRVYGSNFYRFRDCTIELATFTLDLVGGVAATPMLIDGLTSMITGDIAFLMSVKVTSTTSVTNASAGSVQYGGNKYTVRTIKTIDSGATVIDSRKEHIKPYRLESDEPISVVWDENAGTGVFPKTVTVTLEIAHTGLKYNRR